MAVRVRPNNEIVQENIKKWNIPQPEHDYTVVIHCTTYNHGKYIRDALEGFVKQKCSFSFCAIVIDDFSTDDAPQIIKEYATQYPDIIKPILLGENHMQRGVLRDPYFEKWHQSAKYIAQCEGDDYWIDPYKLEKQVLFLEENKDYSMCYGKCLYYYDDKKKISSRLFGGPSQTFEELVKGNTVPTPTVLYRKDSYLLYQTKIKPFEKEWLMGDYPLWLFFACEGKIKFLNKSLAVYRILPESASHTNSEKKEERFIYSTYEIIKFYTRLYNKECVYDERMLQISLFNHYVRFYKIEEALELYKSITNPPLKVRLKWYIIRNRTIYNFLKGRFFISKA